MKRNIDLIRELLHRVEAGEIKGTDNFNIPGY